MISYYVLKICAHNHKHYLHRVLKNNISPRMRPFFALITCPALQGTVIHPSRSRVCPGGSLRTRGRLAEFKLLDTNISLCLDSGRAASPALSMLPSRRARAHRARERRYRRSAPDWCINERRPVPRARSGAAGCLHRFAAATHA